MSASFTFDPTVLANAVLGFVQTVVNTISTYLGPVGNIIAMIAGVTIMIAVARKMPIVGGLIDKVIGYVQSAF
jgi:hypothetical protein